MHADFYDLMIRVGVFLIEVILTLTLIGWMRTASRSNPEPIKYLLIIVFYGGLTAIVAAFVEIKYSFNISALQRTAPQLVSAYGPWYELINNFAASSIEEMGKYMVAVFMVINTRHFHKLTDAILYLILIGLGFSLVEDVFFLLNPSTVPLFRLLSFYIHSGTSSIIGYALGRFKFGLASFGELLVSVLGAIGLHFAYNLSTNIHNATVAFYLAGLITLYISLQIFILFRRAITDEYNLEHLDKPAVSHRLLNWKRQPAK
jgi:RsiW-degrading membrane proteinase PrsW (M82 family)